MRQTIMRIIEKKCVGKREDQSLNEDELVITNQYVAIIDGASSAGNIWGKPGGLMAKSILSQAILEANVIEDGYEFIRYLNRKLYLAQSENLEAFADPTKRLMASVLIYSIETHQVWSYGDCPFLINGQAFGFDKKVDKMNAMLRAYVNFREILAGSSEEELLMNDKGALAIRPLIKIQPVFANKDIPFGYPILDGGELCDSFFCNHSLRTNDELVMASDGYPILLPTLKDSEDCLSRLLAKDPLCIKYFESVKGCYSGNTSYDDRTYVRILI